jgi:predicted ATPase with chaperone activity
MKIFRARYIALCIATGASIGLGPRALAQQTPKPPKADSQAKISDHDLKAFAKAYVEYQKIRQKYESALKSTQDAEKRKKLAAEANDKVKQRLAEQQISIENYNRIFKRVNSDVQLRQKTLQLIDEERKKG